MFKFIAAAMLTFALTFGGLMSWDWAFNLSSFGGYVGFLSVPVLIGIAFLAGLLYTGSVTQDALWDAYTQGRADEKADYPKVVINRDNTIVRLPA
jgi:hypothetical protein